MVCNYQRRPGARSYRDYSDEDLKSALSAVKKGMTLRAAEEKYKVKRETLRKLLKGFIPKSSGHQTPLSIERSKV